MKLKPNIKTPTFMYLLIGVLILAALLMGPVQKLNAAATFAVNLTNDAVDINPGNGVCDDGAGNCTLRAAIMEANAFPGPDTITLPALLATTTVYTLTNAGAGEDASATGDLDITDDLTIIGDGQDLVIIDGGGIDGVFQVDRVFHVHPGTIVAISGLTVRNGRCFGACSLPSLGGGIFNEGAELAMNDVAISANRSGNGSGIFNTGSLMFTNGTVTGNGPAAPGGGIWNNGTLTVTNSTILDNQAQVGGGILNFNGLVTLTNSTISGNRATSAFIDAGGGLANIGGTMMLTNVTVSDNTSEDDGGGISNSRGSITLTNSTVIGNAGGRFGGGIRNFEGDVTLKNTIIANSTSGGDCSGQSGTTASLGHNIDSDGTCNLTELTDLPNKDPLVGLLQDNGGPTLTHALLSSSPAIEAVPVADCTDPDGNPITTDQRGVLRPQGFDCDIGAFELEEEVDDTTPPLCEVQGVNIAHPAPPSNVLVHVRDLGSGLSNVNILTQENIDNVTFTPAITSGTTELVEIVADKADEGAQARFQIEVFDVAGNRSECDPLLAVLDRGPSSPRYSTYESIPQADRYFTISNIGESLLTYALVNVNDRWFVVPTLLSYEVKTIDIGSALIAGDKNTVTVWGGGHRSQVMISDVMPTITNTFAYPDEPLY